MTSSGGPVVAESRPQVGTQVGTSDVGMSDAELAGRLRVAVGLLVRRLRQRDPGHLSPAQLSALVTIEAAGPVRNGDLAARENVGKVVLVP